MNDDQTTTCQHCGRSIVHIDGAWIDPEAAGDDAMWRETCDRHDTFTADHEPVVTPETCWCDQLDCPRWSQPDDDGKVSELAHYTCGVCDRSWSAPTPAARCLFEYEHDDDYDDDEVVTVSMYLAGNDPTTVTFTPAQLRAVTYALEATLNSGVWDQEQMGRQALRCITSADGGRYL